MKGVKAPDIDKFLEKFDVSPSGCWEWNAAMYRNNYGNFRASERGRNISAHRWAYEFWVGPIPEGLQLDHLCRNPPCVNPDHLEPVTNRENCYRGESPWAKRKRQTHCKNGHEFTPDNTYVTSRGSRRCRECARVVQSARKKGRPTACRNGHPYTDDSVYLSVEGGKQRRRCKACQAASARRYYAKRCAWAAGYYDDGDAA